MRKKSVINYMDYDELIEASSVIDDYVHGYELPNEIQSEKVKALIDEIIKSTKETDVLKIWETLSSKIVEANKKSVSDYKAAKEQYRELMMN